MVGPWVMDSIDLYRDLKTGTQYMGTWASRVRFRIRQNRQALVGLSSRT